MPRKLFNLMHSTMYNTLDKFNAKHGEFRILYQDLSEDNSTSDAINGIDITS